MDSCDLGLPWTGPGVYEDCTALTTERLPVTPSEVRPRLAIKQRNEIFRRPRDTGVASGPAVTHAFGRLVRKGRGRFPRSAPTDSRSYLTPGRIVTGPGAVMISMGAVAGGSAISIEILPLSRVVRNVKPYGPGHSSHDRLK